MKGHLRPGSTLQDVDMNAESETEQRWATMYSGIWLVIEWTNDYTNVMDHHLTG
jgi:hypothetical protein